jgi:cytochrome P450 family 3 subfamily A
MKKFHDFIELADEAISDFTKEVDGETVPMWSREEIDEIIMAQVLYRTYFGFIDGID